MSLFWLTQQVLFIFGGLILPPLANPKCLQALMPYTPSYYILGGRSQLTFTSNIWDFLHIAGGLLIWLIVFIFALERLFVYSLKKQNLYGG